MGITVALAEDSMFVREGVSRVLADPEGAIELVAVCDDFDSIVAAVDEHEPQVVVTDIRMPPTSTDEGVRLAAQLRVTHPSIGVVVLSAHADPDYALALMESGSEGRAYLLKDRIHERSQLRAAIHTVAAGGSVMDPKIVEPLMRGGADGARSPMADLTAREREVLGEIAQGKSNAAIAESLVLTKRAVEKHINAIFLKLNLSDAQDVSKRVKATLLFLAEDERLPPAA